MINFQALVMAVWEELFNIADEIQAFKP